VRIAVDAVAKLDRLGESFGQGRQRALAEFRDGGAH